MLIIDRGNTGNRHLVCALCGNEYRRLGASVQVCPECIRDRWEESRTWCAAIHDLSRESFQLPLHPPRSPIGEACDLCVHQCRMSPGEKGYCGVRDGSEESLLVHGHTSGQLSYYYDPLPTNCVADWVCAGGTGAGYPTFAHENGPEAGFLNLAVFFEACNFNCLFCQNWMHKEAHLKRKRWTSVNDLVRAANAQTSCICFFGGDPVPQLPYALQVSEQARKARSGEILRICWETNGSMQPDLLQSMARLSLETGGCVKVDLKAWNPHIHRALTGCDNKQVFANFATLSELIPLRPNPPFLVASTVMIPGYIEAEEVAQIARFIARLNPDIPYALLAFAPEFHLQDFPTTSSAQAEACFEAAKSAGLRRVRIGNQHLLCTRN
jgi:pyruvate formate lyase activating enzyme